MYGLFILFNLSLFTAKTTIKVNYQYYACLNIYNSNNSKVQTNRRAKKCNCVGNYKHTFKCFQLF